MAISCLSKAEVVPAPKRLTMMHTVSIVAGHYNDATKFEIESRHQILANLWSASATFCGVPNAVSRK